MHNSYSTDFLSGFCLCFLFIIPPPPLPPLAPLYLYIILFHRPMAEANAKEGALASHGKRRKRKKEGKKIIMGRK